MHKAFPLPVTEFPLPEELPTAREDSCHCQKKKEATARKIALLSMSRRNCQSKVAVTLTPTSTTDTTTTDTTSGETGMKSGRTVTLTAEDMQKKKNDVKARTTLLLSLLDEHHLRFSKYKTARELWAAILKIFCGNEATNKTKKNLLNQQYGNFRAEGSETLEQTFSRMQVIVGQLQFMDVEVEQDDLNQKFLTSLAPEWLMHTIVWRNRSDLDTMSLDDLYNHLKVYESKVQKKTEPNSQNMAFISLAKHSNGNEDGNTACVSTASTNVPTTSASVATISQDTACAYIASQSSEAPTKFALMANTSTESKVFDNSLCSKDCKKNNDSLNRKITDLTDKLFDAKNLIYHYKLALAQVESRLVEYKEREVKYYEKIKTLEFYNGSNTECIEILKKKLETLKQKKKVVDGKQAGLLTASKDLDNLIESQRADKNKEGLGYSADDTLTDYSRLEPIVESSPDDDKKRNHSVTETVASPIIPKPFVKFIKASDSQSKSPDFVMKKKACFNYGDFNHLAYDCRKRAKMGTTRSQNNTSKIPTHRPVVHRPHEPPMRPMRSNMNGARLNKSFNKPAHSYTNRPFQRKSIVRSQYRAPWVPTINRNFPSINKKFFTGSRNFPTGNRKFPTASRKFPTGSMKFSTADIGMKGKAVKPSACWVLKPSQDLSNKGPNNNSVSVMFKKYTYTDTQGRLKEFSNARTPQQNGVAEKRLIEPARTMLADPKLPVTFWAEAVNIACYVQNRVLVNKSHNKTPYELFNGTKDVAGQEVKKDVSTLRYIALPNSAHDAFLESSSSKSQDDCNTDVPESSGNTNPTATSTIPSADQVETLIVESPISTASSQVPTACFTDSQEPSSETRLISKRVANQEETPSLDNILTLTNQFEDILGVTTNLEESNRVEADVSNMETSIIASPTPTLRIHRDHPKSQIIGHVDTLFQTRNKFKEVEEQGFIATIYQKTDLALLQFCIFSCFFSQVEPKKIFDALQDLSWVEAMQEELLQFKIQKDERGIVIRNKARLVAQGHTQEEGIDYDEVVAPVARIEAIRLFLAYASFIGFTVYQIDVKSAFLYGTIDEEVGTIDQTLFIRRKRGDFILVQVYVNDIIFGSSNPQLCREFKAYMHEKFQVSAMGELNFFLGLQVLQKEDDIFLSQDKYVGDILKKFGYSDVRSSNTHMDKENPWGKDGAGKDVDLYLYRSIIGSLMYLTTSRPDIMFVGCACARHQVTPKECQLHAVKRIFRYLKGHPKLGLWYAKDSPFDLVAYSDSDYGGATQDLKSTTGGCQFLGRRLISWQCKKHTIVATSTTKAEYVAAASCCE
uniref:Reverse transcriptase Ty1/copia-type domain-containing protein n=1 Tax=Tanacetum cinerariifolium TaxID=118510 RepID=A0A6L2LJX4_TANCI|nr:hypothetical protein [Tanacetum cinerariifolium]